MNENSYRSKHLSATNGARLPLTRHKWCQSHRIAADSEGAPYYFCCGRPPAPSPSHSHTAHTHPPPRAAGGHPRRRTCPRPPISPCLSPWPPPRLFSLRGPPGPAPTPNLVASAAQAGVAAVDVLEEGLDE